MRALIVAGLALALAPAAAAHDLFLKPDAMFLAERANVRVRLYNGTFVRSEGIVTRDRVADLSLVTPEGRFHPEDLSWRDQAKISEFAIGTKDAGTYVLGLSVKPRELRLDGKHFNAYLKEEGIADVLSARAAAGELDKPSAERYSKHVKALIQVGKAKGDVTQPLGYPAEIVPLVNPYEKGVGATFEARCVVDGAPAAGVTVFAGHTSAKGRIEESPLRADAEGRVAFPLKTAGRWYVKFVRMSPLAEAGLNYESKWATLTFEVR